MNSKVLFILHMPPPVHGASMMGKYIHDSSLINNSFDCHYINLSTASDLSDIGKFRLNKFFYFLNLLLKIYQEIKEFKPSVVYITPNAKGKPFLKDFIVVQLCKMLGCKIVLHYHNKGVQSYENKFLYHLLYEQFFRNVKVILLAKILFNDMKKYVDFKDVFICPNGIPKTTHGCLENRREGKMRILFLSNLLIEKGILDLIETCRLLKQKGCCFICDVVGAETADLDKASFLQIIESNGLSDIVVYHGKQYGESKEAILEQSDIFVFPTYYNNECFPLVLLEAMQHAKVCVATDEGGIRDIIDDGITGYIVPKKNPQVMADKISYLIQNKEKCQQMGLEGYKKYENCYSLNRFEQNMLSIISKLVEKRN